MNWLKKARKRLGLTQQQLADKLGVTRITVARWETKRQPSLNRLFEISALLNLEPYVVLSCDY
ncbi:helix-turn-helix transcriptional regulator [bacterium]|nr:helix-turn-helix transcriptional regulator [bacterium]